MFLILTKYFDTLLGVKMLVKVKFKSEQKYVKVSHSDLKLSDFLDEGNCICNYIINKF